MPVLSPILLVTQIGLRIFDNWCNSRQNAQNQQIGREIERAAQARQTARVWKLLKESQEFTWRFEEEKHHQRMEELNKDMEDLLLRLVYEEYIKHWPLKVLPIVMKNQAVGNLLAHQEENMALHCVLTPSNCMKFNKHVFFSVEKALEQYCNQYWEVGGDHPVLFYSGAWRSNNLPKETQIDSMRTALDNLPTLLITPLFSPVDGKLVIQMRVWGVGSDNSQIILNDAYVFKPTKFRRDYDNNCDYVNEVGLLENIIDDLVPYLQCLVGYMADTYFWSSTGSAPLLPQLLLNGVVKTENKDYLVENSKAYYEELLKKSETVAATQPFARFSLMNLFNGIAVFWDDDIEKKRAICERIALLYFGFHTELTAIGLDEAFADYPFSLMDRRFVTACSRAFKETQYEARLGQIDRQLNERLCRFQTAVSVDDGVLATFDLDEVKTLAKSNNPSALYRLGECYEYSIGTKCDEQLAKSCYEKAAEQGFVLGEIKLDPAKYSYYAEEMQFFVNKGLTQAILLKSVFLCKNGLKEEALNMLVSCYRNESSHHPALLYDMAELLLESDDNSAQDLAQSVGSLLLESANRGYVKAQELVCKLYKGSRVFKEDPVLHAKYAQSAMLQRSPYGTFALGLCYIKGYGESQSTKAGLLLIKTAAAMGYPEAQRLLLMSAL